MKTCLQNCKPGDIIVISPITKYRVVAPINATDQIEVVTMTGDPDGFFGLNDLCIIQKIIKKK